MNARIVPWAFCASLGVLSLSCGSGSNPVDSEYAHKYAMMFLADSILSFSDIEKIPMGDLRLEEVPFLTNGDIDTFTVFYLDNNPKRSYVLILKDSSTTRYAGNVRPFVLVLNGARYCVGEYWPAFMSIMPRSIFMYRAFGNRYHLMPGDDAGNDKLKDARIVEALENAGVRVVYKNIGGS